MLMILPSFNNFLIVLSVLSKSITAFHKFAASTWFPTFSLQHLAILDIFSGPYIIFPLPWILFYLANSYFSLESHLKYTFEKTYLTLHKISCLPARPHPRPTLPLNWASYLICLDHSVLSVSLWMKRGLIMVSKT